MVDSVTPAGAPSPTVELFREGQGGASYLPAGRAFAGVVMQQLEDLGGLHRYEISIQGHGYIIATLRELLVGSILDLIALPTARGGGPALFLRLPGGTREALGIEPNPAPAVPAAGAGKERNPDTPIEAALVRALRREGVPVVRESVVRLAAALVAEGLDGTPAVSAAAKLIRAGLPVLPSLVRGGALVEGGSAPTDPRSAVAALLPLVERAVTESGERAAIVALLRAGAGLDRESSAASEPHVVTRPSVMLLHAGLRRLVATLAGGDPVLIQIQDALALLARDEVARKATLFEGLGEDGRRQTRELLRAMERDVILRQPQLAALREAVGEVHKRMEATQYLQILEWFQLATPEQQAIAGHWTPPREGLPFRFSLRDERRDGGGGGLGFVIDVEAPRLGSVRVAGRLEPALAGADDAPGGALAVHIAADEPDSARRIDERLPLLLASLEAHDYRVTATVARAAPTPSIPARGTGLDLML